MNGPGISLEIHLLALLFAVNGAPIIVQRVLGNRWNVPLDFHMTLPDARSLFGPSKTWRGLAAAMVTGPAVSLALGLSASAGLAIAAGAMAGDLLSSFIKRRAGIAASGQALGLDQIPESLLPLLLVRQEFRLDDKDLFILVVDFLILELLLSRLLYWLRIRRQPY